jgi:hypothetical protein
LSYTWHQPFVPSYMCAISEMLNTQVANLVGYVVGPSGIKVLIARMVGKDGELQFRIHPLVMDFI